MNIFYFYQDKEQRILIGAGSRKDTTVLPPPSYDSIVKTGDSTNFNKLNKSRYLDPGRKPSFGTVSDSDGVLSNGDYQPSFNGKIFHSQSARSSLSNGGTLSTLVNTYPLPPFVQVNVELNLDTTKNVLIVHLTNCEHVPLHPAFDEQAEFFYSYTIIE